MIDWLILNAVSAVFQPQNAAPCLTEIKVDVLEQWYQPKSMGFLLYGLQLIQNFAYELS